MYFGYRQTRPIGAKKKHLKVVCCFRYPNTYENLCVDDKKHTHTYTREISAQHTATR